jgi:ceramide glucosyltransferase
VVVECWEAPMNFQQVWAHQLRWARTIRVSQPAPYFFSVLSNVTLWATLLVLFGNAGGFPLVPEPFYHEVPLPWTRSAVASLYIPWVLVVFAVCFTLRATVANVLQARLTRNRSASRYWWLTFAKDILQFGIWLAAFFGNTITWRGQKFRLQRDGRLRSK